jgi:hypothetical protein
VGKQTVEPVFGIIKSVMRYRQCHLSVRKTPLLLASGG